MSEQIKKFVAVHIKQTDSPTITIYGDISEQDFQRIVDSSIEENPVVNLGDFFNQIARTLDRYNTHDLSKLTHQKKPGEFFVKISNKNILEFLGLEKEENPVVDYESFFNQLKRILSPNYDILDMSTARATYHVNGHDSFLMVDIPRSREEIYESIISTMSAYTMVPLTEHNNKSLDEIGEGKSLGVVRFKFLADREHVQSRIDTLKEKLKPLNLELRVQGL